MVDWGRIKDTVEIRSAKRTGAVGDYEKILKTLMADGKVYTVAQLKGWIEAGLNEGRGSEDPKVKVNWITVHYVLDNKPGFEEVSKNHYRIKGPKKAEAQKK
jgi:hypothetical protein